MTRDNIPVDAHTYAHMILAYDETVSNHNYQRIEYDTGQNNDGKLMEYLKRVTKAEIPQEEPVYTALISAYTTLRDAETVEHLFDAMKQLDIAPSARTFEYV